MKLFLILASILTLSIIGVSDSFADDSIESVTDDILGMEHIFTFGEVGIENGQFDYPSDIVIDKNNQVYVLDRGNNKIHIFSDNGDHLFSFGESIVDQFGYITDIAVDDNGKIYVCDDGKHKIHVFSDNGDHLFSFGSEGVGDGELSRPQGLAVGHDSRIYVTDSENNRIQVFSDTGDSIFSFGEKGSEDGQFFNLRGIDIDSDGNLYVVDRGNSRVQIFTTEGKHLLSFGEKGSKDGQFGLIYDIKVDSENNIYISNEAHDQIQVYSSNGVYLFSFGSYDVGAAHRFQSPMGLAMNANDTIYAVDAGKKNIKVFGKSIKTKINLTTEQALSIGLDDTKKEELWKLHLESTITGYEGKLLEFATREIPLSSALEISVDSERKIFVADNRANLIKVFSDNGKYLYGFGDEQGIGKGDLSMLIGMDMDSKNNLYVANTGYDIIQVFSNDGEFLYDFDTPGTDDEEFNTPIDVAVDKDGRIYVVDGGDSEMQIFSNDGVYLFDIDTSSMYSFGNLSGVDVDDDGKIYVVNSLYVMVFSNDGDFLYGFANTNPNSDEYKMSVANRDVVVDKNGRIYVVDRSNSIVNIFSNDGIYLHTIEGTDSTNGKFNMPVDVEVDNHGNIYIADHGKTRIQMFLLNYDTNSNRDNNYLDNSIDNEAGYDKIIEKESSGDSSFFENIFGFFKSLFG